MDINELEYNTQQRILPLPEYGRNIQRMVDYAVTIEDREERTKCAQTIISIMGNLFPHLRDVPDFKHKLWDHLAIMSDFKLDIDYPYEIIKKDNLNSKPDKVKYNDGKIRIRHYGKYLDELIEKAMKMEDGPEKTHLVQMIGNHMKKSIITWNRESVDDLKIFDDLRSLSGNKIDVKEDELRLIEVRDIVNRKSNRQNQGSNRKNIK